MQPCDAITLCPFDISFYLIWLFVCLLCVDSTEFVIVHPCVNAFPSFVCCIARCLLFFMVIFVSNEYFNFIAFILCVTRSLCDVWVSVFFFSFWSPVACGLTLLKCDNLLTHRRWCICVFKFLFFQYTLPLLLLHFIACASTYSR